MNAVDLYSILVDLWTTCQGDSSNLEMVFVAESLSWLEAEKVCQRSFGHLATVRNSSQVQCASNAMIRNTAAACLNGSCDIMHVGLVRFLATVHYRWLGHLNMIEDQNSRLWLQGHGTAEECGFWQNSTCRLGNNPCSTKRYFICQRQIPPG